MKSFNKKIISLLLAHLMSAPVYATYIPITVQDQDGIVSQAGLTNLKVSNGRITAQGNGVALLDLNGAVTAASSFTDNRIIKADGTTGLQNTGLTIDDSNNVTGAARITTSTFTMTTGASANYVLTSDGSGNATWAASSGATDVDDLEDAITNQIDSIFIGNGSGAVNSGTSYATAVGISTLAANTSGGLNNSAFGYQALQANTTGDENMAIGYQALKANTTGVTNTASGSYSLISNTTGSSNTASGSYSLYSNTTGTGNTAFGYMSLYANTTANQNTAFGQGSLQSNTTGASNAASGFYSLYANTTGASNTVSGYQALRYNQTGSYNVAVGQDAGYGVTSNSFSNGALLGYRAGYALTTGDNNIAVGFQAGDNITTGNSNIVIGYNIDAPSATTSNQLSIGNLIYGTALDGTGTTISTGNIGIGKSSPGAKLDVNGGIFATTIKLTTGATNNYVLKSDASGNATWGDASSLVTTEWTDGGDFIYPTDDSGAETLIIGATLEASADIILGANGDVTFNEQANDADFRVEGQSDSNLIFADASTDKIGLGTASPNSKLHVVGSMSLPITSKTGNYTATTDDFTIAVSSSGGAVTITLPAAAGIAGRLYVIKKTDSSSNLVIVDGNASETIDGASTYNMAQQNQSVTIQSNGTNWLII